jgi:hypothetical protein
VRGAALLLLLALGVGCGVYSKPLRHAPPEGAPAAAPCADGESCENEESH